MKILFIGYPHFAKRIAEELNKFDKENTYLAFDTNNCIKEKIKFFFHVFNSDIIYQFGGVFKKGGALRTALFFKKKIIFNWVGTDVLLAKKEKDINNNILIKKTINSYEAEWIKDEFKKIIKEKIHFVKSPAFMANGINCNLVFPNKFIVFTYINKHREEFYGIKEVLKLAEDFPNIEIRIAGLSNSKYKIPENVKLLGWVNNMQKEMNDSVVFIRIPKHDGLAFTVLEALQLGKYVIRNYDFPETFYAKHYEDIKKTTTYLKEKFDKGELKINQKGIDFVKREYNREKILNEQINFFKKVINNEL